MAGQKFTPYALTALPAVADRDINGIYFIRTPTGMKVYAIENTLQKRPVELDYVDLTSTQTITGRKIFDTSGNTSGFILAGAGVDTSTPAVPGSISLKRVDSRLFISHMTEVGGNFKAFSFDLAEAFYGPSSANGNANFVIPKVTDTAQRGQTTYMGYRREYEILTDISFNTTSYNHPIGNNLQATDMAVIFDMYDKMLWDIVWLDPATTTTTNKRTYTLRDYYSFHGVDQPIGMEVKSSGARHAKIQIRGRFGVALTIPAGAKLIFY